MKTRKQGFQMIFVFFIAKEIFMPPEKENYFSAYDREYRGFSFIKNFFYIFS